MNNQQSHDENSGLHAVQGSEPDLLPTSGAVGLLLLIGAALGFLVWLLLVRLQ